MKNSETKAWKKEELIVRIKNSVIRAGILQLKGGFQLFSRLYQPLLVINLFILFIDKQPIPPISDLKSAISAEMVLDHSHPC